MYLASCIQHVSFFHSFMHYAFLLCKWSRCDDETIIITIRYYLFTHCRFLHCLIYIWQCLHCHREKCASWLFIHFFKIFVFISFFHFILFSINHITLFDKCYENWSVFLSYILKCIFHSNILFDPCTHVCNRFFRVFRFEIGISTFI